MSFTTAVKSAMCLSSWFRIPETRPAGGAPSWRLGNVLGGGDGRVVWHTKTDSAVRNSVAISADRGVFAVSHCGRLSRFDLDSGKVVWSRDLWGFPQRWVAASPVVADGTVCVGAKSGYSAYDAASGQLRWEARYSGTLDLSADQAGDKWAPI